MPGLHSLIGRRSFIASTVMGTIGAMLPAVSSAATAA